MSTGPQPGAFLGLPPDSVWRAPLLPPALAFTAGLLLDRWHPVPPAFSLLAAGCALAAWAGAALGRQRGLALAYLGCATGALGAVYHHWMTRAVAADDISHRVSLDPVPAAVRGVVVREPQYRKARPDDPLRSFPVEESTNFVLRATQLRAGSGWVAVSGRVQVHARGRVQGLGVGDEVEAVGRLAVPAGAANPGEFEYPEFLARHGVRATLSVASENGAVTVLAAGGWSLGRLFAGLRAAGVASLREALPPRQADLAAVLLLGDGAALSAEDWDRYQRSGVLHVLAISGQHFAVVGGFLWLALRVCGVRRRRGAVAVAAVLIGYALLVGGRPPVFRAAVMAAGLCATLLCRRPPVAANVFALAWVAVLVWEPADVADPGCQLSFLAVAVLLWGLPRREEATDPLDRLSEEARPGWLRALRGTGTAVLWIYLISAGVWIAVTPLLAAHFHLVSPAALVIGPPAALLASAALLGGLGFFLLAPLCWPVAAALAGLVGACLAACDGLVDLALEVPGAYWYVPEVPAWWLGVFYLGLLACLTLRSLRCRTWVAVPAGLGWLCLGLLLGAARPAPEEFRCTFLAVGHGGCTVLETPDGRTLLYDAGAMSGPDVARRHIAPFLWARGVRRIDEVFLSHADLDHYNGLAALLERFRVARVSCTPTFAARATAGVRLTLAELGRRGVAVRTLRTGDRLSAGAVTFEVLHPPARGPDGSENERSLVLLVRHAGHAILLTGDLEGEGLRMLLAGPPRPVEVLMAPHHGSKAADPAGLAAWARPRVVVACQGRPHSPAGRADAYRAAGALYLGTWPHGAVTVRSGPRGLTVETFRDGTVWQTRR